MVRITFWTRCITCETPYELSCMSDHAAQLILFERDACANFERLTCQCGSRRFKHVKRIEEKFES